MDDIRQAIYLAINKDVGGEVFQIATQTELSVNVLVDMINDLSEKHLKSCIVKHHTSSIQGEVMSNCSLIKKAEKELGFKPLRKDFYNALEEIFKWFLNRSK